MTRPVHFEIHADDPARAIGFYEGVFGWRITPAGFPGYWLVSTGSGGPGIDGGLLPRRGPRPEPGQPVNAHVLTLSVADVDGTLARALAAGATPALPKMAIPGVGWLAYIHDSEGNILGMMQEDPGAK